MGNEDLKGEKKVSPIRKQVRRKKYSASSNLNEKFS